MILKNKNNYFLFYQTLSIKRQATIPIYLADYGCPE
jgi:hypothetical protein